MVAQALADAGGNLRPFQELGHGPEATVPDDQAVLAARFLRPRLDGDRADQPPRLGDALGQFLDGLQRELAPAVESGIVVNGRRRDGICLVLFQRFHRNAWEKSAGRLLGSHSQTAALPSSSIRTKVSFVLAQVPVLKWQSPIEPGSCV